MAQKPRTRLSKQGRRTQLLDVAAKIIEEEGFSGFTMDLLASRADVSSPLVYKYFDSRRELFEELVHREFESSRAKIRAKLSGVDTFEGIVRVFVNINFQQAEEGDTLSMLMSQPDLRAAVDEKVTASHRENGSFLVGKLIAENLKVTPTEAGHLLVMSSAASLAAAKRVSRSGSNRKKLIENTVRFIMGGVAASYIKE